MIFTPEKYVDPVIDVSFDDAIALDPSQKSWLSFDRDINGWFKAASLECETVDELDTLTAYTKIVGPLGLVNELESRRKQYDDEIRRGRRGLAISQLYFEAEFARVFLPIAEKAPELTIEVEDIDMPTDADTEEQTLSEIQAVPDVTLSKRERVTHFLSKIMHLAA